jgi:hypothetical protein
VARIAWVMHLTSAINMEKGVAGDEASRSAERITDWAFRRSLRKEAPGEQP